MKHCLFVIVSGILFVSAVSLANRWTTPLNADTIAFPADAGYGTGNPE